MKTVSFKIFILSVFLVSVSGCSASFDKREMVLHDYRSGKTQPYSVSVSVGDNNAESEIGHVPVPHSDLQYAIEESIREGKVFEKVISSDKGEYLLNVMIFTLQQPLLGFDFTVKIEAGWTLTKAGGKMVWQKLIKSQYTATTDDAFAAQIRFRLANDGAIRNNITQGLKALSNLNL